MRKLKHGGVVLGMLLWVLPFITRASISLTETHTNVTCNAASTGAINISVSGGALPYTYIWADGPVTEDRTGLTAGNYYVTATDNLGETASLTINITEPTVMTTFKSITNVYCGGASTGAIDLTVIGGTPGYTYAWSDFVFTEDRSNLTAANYYVTITDANSCVKVDSANVTQPPGMVISKTVTNVTCGSGANGAINVTVQFGVPGYLYLWNDGVITEDRTAIAAGTYSLTVTDMSGCSTSTTATVGQTGGGMAVNATSINPSCNGGSNGTITVTSVIGSVGPYTFRWSDGPTTQNRTGMSAGSYTVTATSTTGCTASTTINLTQPNALNVTLTPITLTCFGSNNGAINTNVTGGTSPYTYNWGGGVFTQNRTGLASGNYTVTVTDFKGCTATQTTFVPQPLQLALLVVPSPQACAGGPTGSVTTSVSGGTGSYSYWWGSGVTTPNRTNVNAGTYSVTVTDGNGCTATASSTVLSYTPMTLTSTKVNNTCYGAAAGSINLTVANGWSPYSFIWSNSQTTEDVSGLTTGNYTVTVNDNHSCSATATVSISQPSFPITVNSTITDVTCNGQSNGSIAISVTNGSTPYTYNWGSGITTQNRTALAAGIYNLTITDNSSCSASSAFTVNEPTAISISPTVTTPTCNGNTNGAINLAVSGSYAPYTYNWGGGITTQNRSNISQGNYAVTVTDNHSCSASASITVSQPAVLVVSPVVTGVTCFGGNNGSIATTVNGGTAPYTYNWGGGNNSQNRASLTAGTYNLTITDNAACSVSSAIVVSQPAQLNISSVNTNVSCNAGSNGAIVLTVTGGTTPYNYGWGGGINSQNRTSLTAGTYNVTITDNSGCTAQYSTTITQPSVLSSISSVTQVSCNGGSNGAIALTVAGGTSPYNYNWGGGVVSQNRTGLVAGTYNVTVTDNAGCSIVNSTTVSQPAAISVNATTTNVSCNGGSNGAINIAVTGGTSPFTFNWGSGVTSQNRNSLIAGTYNVTVTDNAGCTVTRTNTISQPVAVTATSVVTSPTCNSGSNGTITLTPAGGTSPYTFSWGGGVTSQNRTGMTAGSYTVTITDNAACTGTHTATIIDALAISISSATTNVACNGGSNGTITLSVIGGSSPYTYDWGGGVISQNRTGLTAGSYTVTVTDNLLCTATHTAVIGQTTTLAVSATPVNVTCNGANTGSVTTSVTGGTAPYSYYWAGGATTPNRVNLAAGNYAFTVGDNAGCTVSNTVVVTQPAVITVSPAVTNVACAGGSTGAINLAVSGGTAPYTYSWGGGVTTPNRTNLAPNTYSVTVTDNAGCAVVSTSIVSQSTTLNISASVTNVSCNGGSNGAINITVNGGTSPYTYNWGSGITTQNRSGLSVGNYTVIVTDNNGCSGSQFTAVLQPSPIVINSAATNISCYGANNGAINVTVSGGTSPYTYNWGSGIVTQNRTNLLAGTYNLTVTDNNSCTASNASTIFEPAAISVITTPVHANCYGASTGAINTSVNGGTGTYTYVWSNGPTTQNNNNIPAGNYSVTVADANNCSASASNVVNQGNAINISSSIVNATCNGLANGSIDITVSGGAGSFSYNWSNGATAQDITAVTGGSYSVTVHDAANCATVTSFNISQPVQIVVGVSKTNVSCYGGNNGSIDISPSGGFTPYVYLWSNNATTEDISGLSAQSYIVTVTDNNSCSTSATIAVTQPAVFSLTETHTNVTCNGNANGVININAVGGTSPFTYSWADGAINQNRTSLQPGNYSVSSTDANGCSASISASINQPATLALSTTKTDVTCAGAATGNIDLTVTGGTATYQYHWNNNTITQDLASITAGTYYVTVTDANNCTATASTTLIQPTPITISFALTNVTCYGGNNGQIVTQTSGGNGGYVYNWSNGTHNATADNLTAGSYTLSINDASNCATSLTIHVTQPNPINLTETHTPISCTSTNNGAINLTVTGGAFPYSYVWSNNATTQDISNLTAGAYSVVVTDHDNCTASLPPVTINQLNGMTLTATSTNVLCNGAGTGSIDLSVAGGNGGYTYHWSNNASTQDINNLQAGSYQVTVTDAGSCIATATATISQTAGVTVSLSKTDATCFGSTNGAVATTIAGGVGGYTYSWSNGATTQNIANVAAGTYSVTVRDGQNCSAISSVAVGQPAQITINETHTSVDCYGNSTGSIQTNVTGGAGSYSYQWSNNATSTALNNLAANTYRLTVTDASLCSTSVAINITQPAVFAVAETHKPYACASKPGSIEITPSGGTAPYNYSWQGGVTTQNRTNLVAGTYNVTVSDARGCVTNTSAIIAQLPQMSTQINKTDVTCNGGSNGTINLSVTGGTAPYTYSWNNGAVTATLFNLTAAAYRVLVMDSNNCNIVDSTTILQPTAININEVISGINCQGETNGAVSVSVTGGNAGGYTYLWNNQSIGTTISNLPSGTYTLTVTDSRSCSASETYTIAAPSPMTVTATVNPVACTGRADGSVSVSVAGGATPYAYNWSNGSAIANITNLNTGAYDVTVTDNNGCTTSGGYIVGMSPAITITPIVQNTACKQVDNGSVMLNVTGGNGSYSYIWNNGQASDNINQLASGNYSVTITDNRNCSVSASYSITHSYDLTIDASAASIINLGEPVQLTSIASADHNNTYSWTPVSGSIACSTCTNTEAAPTSTTLYTVTVIDTNGCRASDTVTVNVNSITDIFIPNAFSPNNDGNNDVFQLFGDVSAIEYLDIKVFDRWGEMVFESNNHNFTWDGTFKGEKVAPGAYIYVAKIAFINGYVRNDMKGTLTVLK